MKPSSSLLTGQSFHEPNPATRPQLLGVMARLPRCSADIRPRGAWRDRRTSGHLPPKRYFHSIGLATDKEVGTQKLWWGIGAVKDTLKNRMYCGDMVQGKHKVVNNVVTGVPQPDWVVVEDTHEAIVSREMFDAAQKTFAGFQPRKEPFFKSPNTENIFLGKIGCAHCGYTMLRRRHSEHAYVFRCNTRFRYSSEACAGNNITEAALKDEVLTLLRRYEPHLAKVLLPSSVETLESDDSKAELTSAQSEFDRTKRFLEGLYESLVSGDISDAEYKDMKSAYEAKISSLTTRIKLLRERIHTRAREEAVLTAAHANVRRLEKVSDLTTDIIDRLVERITVSRDGRVEVKFSFWDEPISNQEEGAVNDI